MDGFVKLLNACKDLLGVLAWPAVLVFVFYKLAPSLRLFLEKTSEISVKAGGVEAVARAQAAAALGAAIVSSEAKDGKPATKSADVASLAADTVNSYSSVEGVDRAVVLWVDDWPQNNVYERQALAAMGIQFVLASSTEDALEKISKTKYDLIISDMQRPPDMKAGYTLLSMLEADHPPYIIYRSSVVHEDVIEAKNLGATGITNKPAELFKIVIECIGRVEEPSWRSADVRSSRHTSSRMVSPRRSRRPVSQP